MTDIEWYEKLKQGKLSIEDDLSAQEQRDLIMRLSESGYFTEKEAKERAHSIEVERRKNQKQQTYKEAKMSRYEQRERKVVLRIRKVIDALEEVKDAMSEEEIEEVLALFVEVEEDWAEGGEEEFDMIPPPPKPKPYSPMNR